MNGPGSERLLYKWYRNGGFLATTREPVLLIKQVVLEDHGIYICTAYNETDSVLSTECVVNGKCVVVTVPSVYDVVSISVITGGRYYHEHNINEMSSIVSAEHNGTNIIFGRMIPSFGCSHDFV